MSTEGVAAGIAYRDHRPAGAEGPPLLLVHGSGGAGLHWPEPVRELPGRRVLTVDLPGHGRSPGPAERTVPASAGRVLALLDALAIPRAVVGGHSMGGAIALTLALDAPDRIAGLVLVGTGARLRVNQATLAITADQAHLAAAARQIAAFSFGSGAGPRLLEPFVAELLAGAPGVLHQDLAACDAFDVMTRLGEVSAPALVICGAEDRLTPPKYSEHLAASLRGARLVRLPDAGHMVMQEAPEQVAEAIAGFLRAAA